MIARSVTISKVPIVFQKGTVLKHFVVMIAQVVGRLHWNAIANSAATAHKVTKISIAILR